MKRFAYSFLVALLTLLPLVTEAQTGTTGTTGTVTSAIQAGLEVKRAGKHVNSDPLVYVTNKQCRLHDEYEFIVKYSAAVPVIELWVGVGTEDCSSVASRQRTTVSSNPVCKLVARHNASLNPTIAANAIDLFHLGASVTNVDQGDDAGGTDALDAGAGDAEADADTAEDAGLFDGSVDPAPGDGSTGCDDATNLQYKVYVLPLPQPTNIEAAKAYEVLTTGYGYSTLVATFTLFTELPEAPGGLSAQSGESQVSVKFSPLSGALVKTTYKAYFDWGTGEGECGSGALVAGGLPPEADETITSVSATAGKATLKNLDDKNIEINSLVAAAVVTVDQAGNESLLSEPICVERQETTSFLDRCKKDPDCKLDSCSLRPMARTGGLLSLSALLALGIALFVRRRHV